MKILRVNRMYLICMLGFPLLALVFFTSLMDEGLPEDMPVGVVDLDNTSTSRGLIRRLDAFQSSRVVAHYPSVNEARRAIQENQIYAFLYIPKGTTDDLLSSRRPKISYYYNMASVMAGSLLMKDLKTIANLGSAAVGQATMRAKGYTQEQIMAFLQPIRIDLHQIANPWTNYNAYLSTVLVPGVMMLFMFLISAYSLGMELKFDRGKEWLANADNNIVVAILGKYLPQAIIFLVLIALYEMYIYGVIRFPHEGGFGDMFLLAVLVCSLWAVLSFSLAGSAFPVMGMDTPIQALSWLFPLRHYYMLYQITVFNGFPLVDAWFHLVALIAFTLLPWLVMNKIKNAMLTYVYIP